MAIDDLIMSVLTTDWQGACQIASTLGLPWQPVALALKRMARDGVVEGREIHRRGTRHRWRISHEFRRVHVRHSLPEWLERRTVPVGNGAVTVVFGVGMVGRSVKRR